MVHEHVLRTISSEKLAVYAVWEPILRTDNERSSRKAVTLLPDHRVQNYWVGTQEVGKLFQAPIDLKSEPAWDVYLVYCPGVTWETGSPPRPAAFMHQLGWRLSGGNHLDGPALAAVIRKMLSP